MAELYTSTVEHHGRCPICRGAHRAYRCTTLIRAGILERWYIILSRGLCLNCLYGKHSSFTCSRIGACERCGTRHNSLLCPNNPNNLTDEENKEREERQKKQREEEDKDNKGAK